MKLYKCEYCGGQFPDDYMADWTICRGCSKQQMEFLYDEEVYIDGLGIAWTKADIEEAGGIDEINRLNDEADIRKGGLND